MINSCSGFRCCKPGTQIKGGHWAGTRPSYVFQVKKTFWGLDNVHQDVIVSQHPNVHPLNCSLFYVKNFCTMSDLQQSTKTTVKIGRPFFLIKNFDDKSESWSKASYDTWQEKWMFGEQGSEVTAGSHFSICATSNQRLRSWFYSGLLQIQEMDKIFWARKFLWTRLMLLTQ